MRIAIISDVHGNDVALQATLADIARAQPDQTICLGDVAASGPQPRAVITRLRSLRIPVVMGNADEWLLNPRPFESDDANMQRIEAIEPSTLLEIRQWIQGRRRRVRRRTRRWCTAVAISIQRSEPSGFQWRRVSVTARARLMPAMACSPRTRTRDQARWCRLSARLNALPRGFFSVAGSGGLRVHSLESLCLGARWCQADKSTAHGRPSCCHAADHCKSDSNRRHGSWGSVPARYSWRAALSACHCNTRAGVQDFSVGGDGVRYQQSRNQPLRSDGVPRVPSGDRRARVSHPARRTPPAR